MQTPAVEAAGGCGNNVKTEKSGRAFPTTAPPRSQETKCRCGSTLAVLCPQTCLFVREPHLGGADWACRELLDSFLTVPTPRTFSNLGRVLRKYLSAFGWNEDTGAPVNGGQP